MKLYFADKEKGKHPHREQNPKNFPKRFTLKNGKQKFFKKKGNYKSRKEKNNNKTMKNIDVERLCHPCFAIENVKWSFWKTGSLLKVNMLFP